LEALEDRTVWSRAGIAAAVHGAIAPTFPVQGRLARPAVVTVGALGDSYTDEYRFYPPDRSRARNWVEMLAATHKANFGAFSNASRGEPRDQGFAFNWARSDSTTSDLVANQLPGLASQVARGQVQYAWIFSGGNDFLHPLRALAAQGITPDRVPGDVALLGQIEARAEDNFTTAVRALLAASPSVRLVVATVPGISLLPVVQAVASSNSEARALVGAADLELQKYDGLIRGIAAGSDRVALADLAAEMASLEQGPSSAPFDGARIELATPGDDYHHFFLADGIHTGTVAQGLIADAFIGAIDSKFGARIAPLSPARIVHFAAHVTPDLP
jgi:hypothetical protein